MSAAEEKLAQLGLVLPSAPQPGGSYVPYTQDGNRLYIAGQVPFVDGEVHLPGALGRELSVEQGQEAARIAVLNGLAVIKAALGSLDRVERVLLVQGFVQVANGFSDVHVVMNGASDLLQQVFGEAGKHARTAVGAASLPKQSAVELQFIVAFKP